MIGLLAMSVQATAQDNQTPAPGKAYERVEQYKKIRLMEVLNLDEQTFDKILCPIQ